MNYFISIFHLTNRQNTPHFTDPHDSHGKKHPGQSVSRQSHGSLSIGKELGTDSCLKQIINNFNNSQRYNFKKNDTLTLLQLILEELSLFFFFSKVEYKYWMNSFLNKWFLLSTI
jgi:hypothetical protein